MTYQAMAQNLNGDSGLQCINHEKTIYVNETSIFQDHEQCIEPWLLVP